ncbi:hypothetical protein BBJ28_00023197 [Nothophytophthora sp. Chile5]|nr:hypothetical protein BBJ28_00023197 [Nothophytophthora sp. Chile5]
MLGMGMLQLWQFTWSVAVVGAIASFRSGFCRAFVLQGKMRTPAALAQLPGLALLRLEVPKSYWTWFYLVGALHTTAILLVAVFGQRTQMAQRVLHLIHNRTDFVAGIEEASTAEIRIQPHTIAFLTLFAVHTTRRFLESVYITAFGDARMHATILFVGIYHYVATVLSVLFDPDSVTPHEDTTLRRIMQALGGVLFVVATGHQSRCNYLLASQKRANNMQHVIPRGDWFDAVRSPHYTAEILLYVAFILITGGSTVMLYFASAWVVANQVLLAHISFQWVDDKFRDRIDELPKWKLLPFVW